MLRDNEGNRLFRKVIVRIVFPDAIFPPKNFVQHAGPHQGFNPNGIDEILMNIADRLDQLYPWWEFRVVELAPEGRTAKYVFTFAGYRSGIGKPVNAAAGQAMADAVRLTDETIIQNHVDSTFTQPQSAITLEPETEGSLTPTEIVGNTLAIPLSQE